MNRRRLVVTMLLAAGTAGLGLARAARAAAETRGLDAIRSDWRELAPAGAELSLSTEPITRSAQAWRAQLEASAYHVLFEEGTEAPFSSALNAEKRVGLYLCAACELPLFTSEMKFDSGTGWPSFFTHIPGHLATKTDYKLVWPRTEYHCIRCGGHQGHVFPDGPPPTGERWCNNGVALRFLAR
ncbi:MAG: peptide-methionine (R)-S-oxide reductase MsrB [Ectothiorhodospiraceae bacterium]|nr:peptide-methionine (R)-S-oxide reductase MsrB [Ectothiorhodospiraceae bacterium]